MAKTIGFLGSDRKWEGPVIFELSFHEKHTKTVRYKSRLKTRYFDLYLPILMTPKYRDGSFPDTISVTISKGNEPKETKGFLPVKEQGSIGPYEFTEAMENSVKYCFSHEGQGYNLYIPYEVFKDDEFPRSLYLEVGSSPCNEPIVNISFVQF